MPQNVSIKFNPQRLSTKLFMTNHRNPSRPQSGLSFDERKAHKVRRAAIQSPVGLNALATTPASAVENPKHVLRFKK